jgi:hypothetical protein
MGYVGENLHYHGSHRKIDRFHPVRYEGAAGIYFTDSVDVAWEFARGACLDEGDAPTVMCVRLDLRNPIVLAGMRSQVISEIDVAAYREAGYDGAVGVDDDGQIYEYVAFDPDQVVVEDILSEHALAMGI